MPRTYAILNTKEKLPAGTSYVEYHVWYRENVTAVALANLCPETPDHTCILGKVG